MSHPLREPSAGAAAACAGLALALLLPAALHGATAAGEAPPKPLTGAEVLAASTAADWRALDPLNTPYLELAARRGLVELPPLFAPPPRPHAPAPAPGHHLDWVWVKRPPGK